MSGRCALQRGAILIDGVPVPHIQHAWLHSQASFSTPHAAIMFHLPSWLAHDSTKGLHLFLDNPLLSNAVPQREDWLFCVLRPVIAALQVSIVSQEPVLFAESILYNITFGVQDPDSVPLAQVCLLCSLRDLLMLKNRSSAALMFLGLKYHRTLPEHLTSL